MHANFPQIILRSGSTARRLYAPVRQGLALHGAEDLAFEVGILRLQRDDQFLDLLPLGMLVGGTDVVDDGQFIFLGKMRDSLFSDIEHGADLRDAGAAEIRYGLKAADAALVEKAHEKCFNGIVKMVTERDLVAAQFQQHVVQRTAAHFRTSNKGFSRAGNQR